MRRILIVIRRLASTGRSGLRARLHIGNGMPGLLRDISVGAPGTLLLCYLIAIDMRRDPASRNPDHQYQAEACETPSETIHDALHIPIYAGEHRKASDYFLRGGLCRRRDEQPIKTELRACY